MLIEHIKELLDCDMINKNVFEGIIEEMGLNKEAINIPSPYVHNYNAQHDIFESKLINEFEWKRTSLRDEDIQ